MRAYRTWIAAYGAVALAWALLALILRALMPSFLVREHPYLVLSIGAVLAVWVCTPRFKWLRFLAVPFFLFWVVFAAFANPDPDERYYYVGHSGLLALRDEPVPAHGKPPITISWAHDLSKPWWQPITHRDGSPIWIERGDRLVFRAIARSPFTTDYMAFDRKKNVAAPLRVPFTYEGYRTEEEGHLGHLKHVRELRNKGFRHALINRAGDATVFALQAAVFDGPPDELRDHAGASEVGANGTVRAIRSGYLYVCPNLSSSWGGKWTASGTGEIVLTVYARDGSVRAPGGGPPTTALPSEQGSAPTRIQNTPSPPVRPERRPPAQHPIRPRVQTRNDSLPVFTHIPTRLRARHDSLRSQVR